jgi:hypothetical protein
MTIFSVAFPAYNKPLLLHEGHQIFEQPGIQFDHLTGQTTLHKLSTESSETLAKVGPLHNSI